MYVSERSVTPDISDNVSESGSTRSLHENKDIRATKVVDTSYCISALAHEYCRSPYRMNNIDVRAKGDGFAVRANLFYFRRFAYFL